MEPLGILYGIVTYACASKLLAGMKKPMKKAAVLVTSQMFGAMDTVKEAAYNIKEGFEDIIAEAQYENMKRSRDSQGSEDDSEEGGES